MPKARFTEADIRRAIKAVQASGLNIAAVEIAQDGAIRIHTESLESKKQQSADEPRRWVASIDGS